MLDGRFVKNKEKKTVLLMSYDYDFTPKPYITLLHKNLIEIVTYFFSLLIELFCLDYDCLIHFYDEKTQFCYFTLFSSS